MKILHVGGYAPVTQVIARQQIASGHTVKMMCVSQPERVFDVPPALAQMLPHLPSIREEKFDIIQFHRAECFLSVRHSSAEIIKELKALKRLGTKLVYYSYGCDSLRGNKAAESAELLEPEILACFAHIFIGSHDQVPYAVENLKKRWSWLPIPVRDRAAQAPSGGSEVVKVVHIPGGVSSTDSDFIVVSIGLLNETELKFEFKILEPQFAGDLSKIEAAIQGADIIIEQVMRESIGLVGAMALAEGKVVLSNYSDKESAKLIPEMKDCPVVKVQRDSLREKLTAYISDHGALRHRGAKSREFARQTHSAETIGNATIDVYRKLLPQR